jgi:hypothetical protein
MSVTVSGRAPTGPDVSMVYNRSGRQLVIRANGLDDQTLRDYLTGLADKPMAAHAPFTFELVPAAFTVDNIMPSAVTFAPPGVPADAGFAKKIAVLLDEGSADGTEVTGEGATVRRSLGDGRTLTVQVPATVPLTGTDLARFAQGISPTGAAAVGHG